MTTLTQERSVHEQAPRHHRPADGPALETHPWRRFARHYSEMSAVMVVGMVGSAFILMVLLNLAVEGELTWEEALLDYPVHALLAIAFGMSVPMIPWMRYRGHTKRAAYEMAIVMAALVIPFVCLAAFGLVDGAQCGLYCLLGFVAMFGLMVDRRDTYAGHTAHINRPREG